MSRTPGTTICDLVARMPSRPQDRPAYKTKLKGRWKDVSWLEYFEQIESLACALLELGFKPGERLALMASTRWEWSVTDLAVMGLQGVIVPVYQTSTAEDLEYILNNSEARFLVLENRAMLKMYLALRER